MKKLLTHAISFWAGGAACLYTYYAVWLAVNPQCHQHVFAHQMILLWPYYRVLEMIAFCF